MKKLLALGACLVALSIRPAAAQTGGSDIVMVRLYEQSGMVHAVIVRGEGKTEEMDFRNGYNGKAFIASGEGYYKMLAPLYREGYTVQSTFSTPRSINEITVVTLVLAKGQPSAVH
jgi:hypothetical protein